MKLPSSPQCADIPPQLINSTVASSLRSCGFPQFISLIPLRDISTFLTSSLINSLLLMASASSLAGLLLIRYDLNSRARSLEGCLCARLLLQHITISQVVFYHCFCIQNWEAFRPSWPAFLYCPTCKHLVKNSKDWVKTRPLLLCVWLPKVNPLAQYQRT